MRVAAFRSCFESLALFGGNSVGEKKQSQVVETSSAARFLGGGDEVVSLTRRPHCTPPPPEPTPGPNAAGLIRLQSSGRRTGARARSSQGDALQAQMLHYLLEVLSWYRTCMSSAILFVRLRLPQRRLQLSGLMPTNDRIISKGKAVPIAGRGGL
jgi:hypothetical protein